MLRIRLGAPFAEESLSLVQGVRCDVLQKRLDLLMVQYAEASEQLNTTLDAANRPILRAQIQGIEEDIAQVEREMNEIVGK